MEILKIKEWLNKRNSITYTIEVRSYNENIKNYLKQIEDRMSREPFVDPKTGNINLKYNPMNITKDYFIPIR